MAGRPTFCVNKTMIIVGKEDFFWLTRQQKFKQHLEHIRSFNCSFLNNLCPIRDKYAGYKSIL